MFRIAAEVAKYALVPSRERVHISQQTGKGTSSTHNCRNSGDKQRNSNENSGFSMPLLLMASHHPPKNIRSYYGTSTTCPSSTVAMKNVFLGTSTCQPRVSSNMFIPIFDCEYNNSPTILTKKHQ